MNVFAKFDEIPSMILQDIKETKRYGHKNVSDTQSFGQRENSIPSHKQFAGGGGGGGIKMCRTGGSIAVPLIPKRYLYRPSYSAWMCSHRRWLPIKQVEG